MTACASHCRPSAICGRSDLWLQDELFQYNCRLRNLSEILDKHLGYLRAAVALESLSSDSPADAEQDESGGKGKDSEDNKPPQMS